MSRRCVVRLGRIYAGECADQIPPGLLRYSSGGMKLMHKTVPLLEDHEEGKRIGTVDQLITFDDVDGLWLAARAELYPDAGAWVKRGTPASFYSIVLNESSFVDRWIVGGYVAEVSLLHRERPAEPGARVTLLYEPKQAPRAPARVRRPAPVQHARTIHWAIGRRPRTGQEEIDELHARIELAQRAGLPDDFELILEQLRHELGYGRSVPWWRAHAKAA
jgi:hypothetical protein